MSSFGFPSEWNQSYQSFKRSQLVWPNFQDRQTDVCVHSICLPENPFTQNCTENSERHLWPHQVMCSFVCTVDETYLNSKAISFLSSQYQDSHGWGWRDVARTFVLLAAHCTSKLWKSTNMYLYTKTTVPVNYLYPQEIF